MLDGKIKPLILINHCTSSFHRAWVSSRAEVSASNELLDCNGDRKYNVQHFPMCHYEWSKKDGNNRIDGQWQAAVDWATEPWGDVLNSDGPRLEDRYGYACRLKRPECNTQFELIWNFVMDYNESEVVKVSRRSSISTHTRHSTLDTRSKRLSQTC